MGVPEWISHYKEGDVDLIGVFQDVVAGGFDHFAVGDGNGTAIEGFLLSERHQLAMVFLLNVLGNQLTSTSFSTSRTAVYASR
jgi:hypothetical protein